MSAADPATPPVALPQQYNAPEVVRPQEEKFGCGNAAQRRSATVIVPVPVFPPALARMVAVPAEPPVTTPEGDTLAMPGWSLAQVKVVEMAFPLASSARAARGMLPPGTTVAAAILMAAIVGLGGGDGGPAESSLPPPHAAMSAVTAAVMPGQRQRARMLCLPMVGGLGRRYVIGDRSPRGYPRLPQGVHPSRRPMTLYLRTLGGLSLDPGTVAISRGRLAILACIAAAGRRGLARERLVALFWPESDTDRARGALKQATFHLRRESGAADLLLGTSELRLNPEVIGADIWDLEHAIANGEWERAVGLYAGPFLDGVHLNGNPEFERWADQERGRLARGCHRALESLARSAEQDLDHTGAVRWWRQLAAFDPLSSTVAVALMRALVAAGDGAAALRHAQVHEALVQDELGAPADIAVRELERTIREASAAVPPSPAPPDHHDAPPTAGEAAPLTAGEGRHETRPGSRVRIGMALAAVLLLAAALGARLVPALTIGSDPLFSSWSHAAAMPEDRESIRELGLGIAAFRRAVSPGPELSEALVHFRASARLDSTSATPLVWAAFANAWWERGPQADSLFAELRGTPREFGLWDRAMLDVTQAWVAGNLAAAHAASHRLVALAPKSEWRLLLAWDAWSVGRAKEAIEVLQSFEPDRDWISGRYRYWAVLGAAYHLAGDFTTELETARRALATEPDSRSLIQLEVRALAALGRDQEVEARCERALTLKADHSSDYQPCGQGIVELWAHGNPAAARRLADRLVAQYAIVPDGALDIAQTLLDVRDVPGAERALGDHRPEELEDPAHLETVTLLAASRGDRAGVHTGLERLDALTQAGIGETRPNRRSFRRAECAALLGDREAAVAWLTRAFREGLRIRTALHWDYAFDGLSDYPPFQALLKPVEGSDAEP